MERKIRVLIAKVGLDGHDKGARMVARGLRDAGMEVVYTGLYQTPEGVVAAALQEDVDVVGISVLTGNHLRLFPEVRQLLDEKGLGDIVLIAGGLIPEGDAVTLKESGAVAEVFGSGVSIEAITMWIKGSGLRSLQFSS